MHVLQCTFVEIVFIILRVSGYNGTQLANRMLLIFVFYYLHVAHAAWEICATKVHHQFIGCHDASAYTL